MSSDQLPPSDVELSPSEETDAKVPSREDTAEKPWGNETTPSSSDKIILNADYTTPELAKKDEDTRKYFSQE